MRLQGLGAKKIVLIEKNSYYFSIGFSVYKFDKLKKKSEFFIDLSDGYLNSLLARINITSRLFRFEIDHFIPYSSGYYIIANRKIFTVDKYGKIKSVISLIGSRPLCVALQNDRLIYGEYSSNINRNTISIFEYDGKVMSEKITLTDVRHVHGVFIDQYTDEIYFTTGDSNDESNICRILEDGEVEKIVMGSQQTRAVQLLFDKNFIYFGTDTPQEKNHIYKISKFGQKLTCIGSVPSSVFYGTRIDGKVFFSTVAEPTLINENKKVGLYLIDKDELKEIVTFKKDIFSYKFFQYAQVKFPKYEVDDKTLYFYTLGTTNSGKSYSINVEGL